MSFIEQVGSLIKAATPLIWVVTHEETRVLDDLFEVSQTNKRQLWTWSSYQGLVTYDPTSLNSLKRAPSDGNTKTMAKSWVPQIALECIAAHELTSKTYKGTIWVLKDFHTCLSQTIPRILRDIRRMLMAQRKTILIVSPTLAHGPSGTMPGIEPTLEKDIAVIHYELPTRPYIHSKLIRLLDKQKEITANKSQLQLDYTPEQIDSFTSALSGLTDTEIDSALGLCFRDLNKLDTAHLLKQKRQIIERSEILEYIHETPSLNDVGGLDLAKKYFQMYSNQFTSEAKDYGVDPLRGVLLVGVPGAGKSLISRTIAAEWKIPALRLDIGRVMAGIVGASEARMREVISQAIAIAPCLLTIDEIEKGLSGSANSGGNDGGTLSRVFGTLLTAMEEKMSGVIIVATANQISSLPPELIRRFNEVMFVDLPTPEERKEILEIHLRKRGRNIKKLKLNIDKIIAAMDEFTGSEIEKVVQEAIARAFHAGKEDITEQELIGAAKDTRCIAKVMSEKITDLRKWAKDRARFASSGAEKAAKGTKSNIIDAISLALQD